MYKLIQGSRPLLVSMPHVGTHIPEDLRHAYVPRALDVEDTDWHLETLYAFAQQLGASLIIPTISRYVIDLNRPPDNTPMYPGASNTELCPTRFFTGDDLYRTQPPDEDEIARRKQRYWQPYHDALARELQRIKQTHGHALLWDAHSIRSEIAWLFEGKLPDLNLGTASGHSCDQSLRENLTQILLQHCQYTYAVDGRFKGGYITRHYGQPHAGIHAVQLEMCQSTYMQETLPFAYLSDKAEQVQPLLQQLLNTMLSYQP